MIFSLLLQFLSLSDVYIIMVSVIDILVTSQNKFACKYILRISIFTEVCSSFVKNKRNSVNDLFLKKQNKLKPFF